ncbi:MAG: hypothetical protein WCD70_02040 [Alphaproteobacteria bacterium]
MNAPDPRNDEQSRRRKQRNWAVFLALLAFVALVYAVTIVKIKMGYGQ